MNLSEICFDHVFNDICMNSKVFKFSCVDEPEFLVLHEFYEGPKSFGSSLNVVEEVSCNQVHPLDVTDFTVIHTVGHEDLSQHISISCILSESCTVRVGSVNVFVDLNLELFSGSYSF